jgi:hypothetical protein
MNYLQALVKIDRAIERLQAKHQEILRRWSDRNSPYRPGDSLVIGERIWQGRRYLPIYAGKVAKVLAVDAVQVSGQWWWRVAMEVTHRKQKIRTTELISMANTLLTPRAEHEALRGHRACGRPFAGAAESCRPGNHRDRRRGLQQAP